MRIARLGRLQVTSHFPRLFCPCLPQAVAVGQRVGALLFGGIAFTSIFPVWAGDWRPAGVLVVVKAGLRPAFSVVACAHNTSRKATAAVRGRTGLMCC